MSGGEILAQATRLRKNGEAAKAVDYLVDQIRRDALSSDEIEAAGRFIIRENKSSRQAEKHLRILLLGQCTTSWLKNVIAAVCWGHGISCAITDGEYDNVIQDLAGLEQDSLPDILVLVPWSQRLLSDGDRESQHRVQEEIEFWQQAWRMASERGIQRLVQVGYDWIGPGPSSFGMARQEDGHIGLVRQVNAALAKALPDGGFFVSLEEISGIQGRAGFYDARQYFWTKQPFSDDGTVVLAAHIAAGIRAITTGPKKVLVLDLDNTLWGGVVGEAGPMGVVLGEGPEGEAYRAFQKYVSGLSKQGVILAVCSKNNPADAREVFERNPEMVLRLDAIACFVANWESKAENLRAISKELNLGLDSFVFFDDSKTEQELIRQSFPQVSVVNVPADPADYIRSLQSGLWFETVGLTAEDRVRTEQYAAESNRRTAEATSVSAENYLVSLAMQVKVRPIDDDDIPRAIQLLAKTNQFNLTTRRHTADQVRGLLQMEGAFGLTFRLADRFGEYGLIAVLIAVPDANSIQRTLIIDTFLMSCRVIGRTVEEYIVNSVVERARALGYHQVIGEFIPTQKNQLVSDLYERVGFAPIALGQAGQRFFGLTLSPNYSLPTFVQPAA